MKNTSIVIFLVLIFVGCNKAIQITQPTILVKNEAPKVFDSIQIDCIEHAEIDGVRYKPDYYSWSILDKDHQVIFSDFKDSLANIWVPDSVGYYVISLKIGYDSNKSITTLKEVEVQESALSLQKKLIGKWTGKAVSMWGDKWQVDLTFDQEGHYSGKVHDPEYVNGGYIIGGPFGYSSYIVNYSFNVSPSENVPCNTFSINQTMENIGFGLLSVSTETLVSNVYNCTCGENLVIEELEFSNKDKGLFFSINGRYDPMSDWNIRYNLNKIE